MEGGKSEEPKAPPSQKELAARRDKVQHEIEARRVRPCRNSGTTSTCSTTVPEPSSSNASTTSQAASRTLHGHSPCKAKMTRKPQPCPMPPIFGFERTPTTSCSRLPAAPAGRASAPPSAVQPPTGLSPWPGPSERHPPAQRSLGSAEPPPRTQRSRLFGGGSLAAGGAGVAGGVAVLTAIAATPVALFAAGGLALRPQPKPQATPRARRTTRRSRTPTGSNRTWSQSRSQSCSRRRHRDLRLHRHSCRPRRCPLARPTRGRTTCLDSLGPDGQERYRAFLDIAGAQEAVVSLNFESLVRVGDDERDALVDLADHVLSAASDTIRDRV